MNLIFNLILYELIGISFAFDSDYTDLDPNDQNYSNLSKCLNSDNTLGLCLSKELCISYDSETNNCANEEMVCCQEINPKKFGSIWSPIQSIINAINHPMGAHPSVPNNSSNITNETLSDSNKNKSSICGLRKSKGEEHGYIVGGKIASPHSWPWIVAIYSKSESSLESYRFVCGGSVISSEYVLGAAHCVSHRKKLTPPENIRLLIGAHDRRNDGFYYSVDKIIVHKNFDETVMQNDIALYHLSEKIDFSKTSDIAPICLPNKQIDKIDLTQRMVNLVGWGTLFQGGPPSDYLRQVQVPILPNKKCSKSYTPLMINAKQLCAGFWTGEKDSCQGDSGGPMILQTDDKIEKFVQIGIVSWGKGCAEPKYPGVYTKVSAFLDWIRDNSNVFSSENLFI